MRTVRPAGEKQPTHFTLLVEKISICTTGESKESLGSHVCPPSPSTRAIIICDLRHSLLLLPRCIIYYFVLFYDDCHSSTFHHKGVNLLLRVAIIIFLHTVRKVRILYALRAKNSLLSKVELVKIAPPFQLVEKTTNLLVNIHYFTNMVEQFSLIQL